MSDRSFKEQVKKELESLSKEQIVSFAYSCGLRALPFLGINGDFGYWKKEEQGKHLFTILWALDATADTDAVIDATYDAVIDATYDAAAAAAYAAADAAYAAVASSSAVHGAQVTAAAANTAHTAHTAVLATVDADVRTADVATQAVHAAVNASKADASADINLQDQLLRDLRAIQTGKQLTVNIDDYGEVWNNFQTALQDIGCGYWGKLYQQIFENNFVLDEEALERRLNVPEEIREQGAAAVANYLEELEKGAKRLNEARIIILGDKGAGKTCVARRLVDPEAEMTTPEESTAGVETLDWSIPGEEGDINVSIWDFAGHTVTHAAHRFFLSERCLYILVHNGRTENNERLGYWLDHMKNYGGDSKAVILVNKRDKNRVEIPYHNLKEQYAIAGLHTFSVKDDIKEMQAFREGIAAYISTNPSWSNKEIPASYYEVKSELEQLFRKPGEDKPQEHLSREVFDAIARKHEVEDIEQLLKDLHHLGVSLWYDEISAFNSLVLNPEWISHGVYRIINWVSNNKKNGLTFKEFKQVFKEELARYPEGECHTFLFDLMKHYELAYETTAGKRLVIPHLLKEDRPAELPVFEVGESLKLQYRADQQLPPHTISRFIVRHHEQIKGSGNANVWRHGVVLVDGKGSTALVREEDRTISVSVKGASKSAFIDELRTTLNEIFDSYKSDRPTLEYRIKVYGELSPTRLSHTGKGELFLSEASILNHLRNDRPFYDDQTNEDIPLGETADSYKLHPDYNWHVFISHASEDKEEVALPLARALERHRVRVWLDADQLLPGDRLKDALTKGVAKSRYGIIIFSEQYFKKKWTQQELAAFLSREQQNETVIIPIMHGVTIDDIKTEELLMADRIGMSTDIGMEKLVEQVLKVLKRG